MDNEVQSEARTGVLRLPTLRELPYILPAALSLAVTAAAFFGGIEEAGRGVFLLLSVLMTAAMTALLFVHVGKRENTAAKVMSAIPPVIFPAAAMFLLESMCNNPFAMAGQVIFLNLIFFYIIAAISFFATRRTAFAAAVPCIYALIAGTAEHYVLAFRSVPLFPWDIASAGVAASVAGNYDFSVSASFAASLTALFFLIYLGFYFGTAVDGLKKLAVRLSACAVSLVMLFGYGYYLSLDRAVDDFGLLDALFVPVKVYQRNGFTVSFLMTLRYVSVDKPDGYSDGALADIAEEIKNIDGEDAAGEAYSDVSEPNIIVVMNEAFSDLSVLTDFETNEDYIPFIRSLSEDTVKGHLHVSVLGGNTANTEYEFLTGLSMAFLPPGSIPYQQYVERDVPTLASQLANAGYKTLAVHPYLANGWERNEVYKHFGFEEMYFRSDIPGRTTLRSYVSDISVFNFIERKLMEKEPGTPMFVFNVTMQNHGGYGTRHNNFYGQRIIVDGQESNFSLSQYLSLLRATDEAVESLVKFLKSFDEPTILMLFGDHQPASSLAAPILRQEGVTLDLNDINDREKYYEVPFFIWANYDIREEEISDISANYLSTLLCRVANVELTDAQKFLSELRQSYPTLTANSFTDKDGKLHDADEAAGEEPLRKYSMLAYNYLFDGNTTGLFE